MLLKDIEDLLHIRKIMYTSLILAFLAESHGAIADVSTREAGHVSSKGTHPMTTLICEMAMLIVIFKM